MQDKISPLACFSYQGCQGTVPTISNPYPVHEKEEFLGQRRSKGKEAAKRKGVKLVFSEGFVLPTYADFNKTVRTLM